MMSRQLVSAALTTITILPSGHCDPENGRNRKIMNRHSNDFAFDCLITSLHSKDEYNLEQENTGTGVHQ